MSKKYKANLYEMETRKKTRKAFPYSRKILELYQKGQCKECTVEVTAIDITPFIGKTKPLSDKEVAKILEGADSESDASNVSSDTLSPRTESRLRKKENGMVLLPRSFYNEHPAKKALGGPRSKNVGKYKKETDSRRKNTSMKSWHQDKTHSKSSKYDKSGLNNNSSIGQKENEPLGRGLRHKMPTTNRLKSGKPSFNESSKKTKVSKSKPNGLKSRSSNLEPEYQLVFVESTNSNANKAAHLTMLSLSDLLNTEKLPSKIWEVERVPPLLVNTKSDVTYNTIAAELDALMAEANPSDVTQPDSAPQLSNTEDKSLSIHVLDESNRDESMETDTAVQSKNVPDEHMDNPKDVKEKITDLKEDKMDTIKESVPPAQMEIDDTEPTENKKEIIVLEDVKDTPVPKDSKGQENLESTDVVKSKLEENSDLVTVSPMNEKDPAKIDTDKTSSVLTKNTEDEPTEDFPSIMDLLNETSMSQQDVPKEGKETPDKIEETPDKIEATLSSNTKNVLDKSTVESSIDKIDSRNLNIEEKSSDQPKAPEKDTDNITSVVFRRYSADKKAYDRLVIFQADLEYTVKINNKEVELLGAPKYMTSTEDLQILLQIVDEVNLDSFNVTCKTNLN